MSPELADALSALSAWAGACLVFGWVCWRVTDHRPYRWIWKKWSR